MQDAAYGTLLPGRRQWLEEDWGDRLTTVFPQQGHYATDLDILAKYPHGDIQLAHIGTWSIMRMPT